MKPLCIYGSGGCAREAALIAYQLNERLACFVDKKSGDPIDTIPLLNEEDVSPSDYRIVVALGNPYERKRVVDKILKLQPHAEFATLVAPSALVLHRASVVIGHGSIICPTAVLTRNVVLGSWSLVNIGSRLGHDLQAGDYFTSAYGVNVSGHNYIGRHVMLGAGVSTRDGIAITDDVLVGAGAVVVSDLEESGIYMGVPARKRRS